MRFITLKLVQNNYSKCYVFASSALLHQFFTSNSVVFIDRGRAKIFLTSGSRVSSYAAALGLGLYLGLGLQFELGLELG